MKTENTVSFHTLDANRNVFRAVLKLFTDEELRMEHSNCFHAAGPATTNARSPNFALVRWTTRSPRADDRVRPSTLDELIKLIRVLISNIRDRDKRAMIESDLDSRWSRLSCSDVDATGPCETWRSEPVRHRRGSSASPCTRPRYLQTPRRQRTSSPAAHVNANGSKVSKH